MPCQFLNQRPLAGTGQNLRAVRLLDFFDHCTIPCSLYHPLDAVAGDAFVNPSIVGFIQKKKALTTGIAKTLWLRRLDLNQRPSGYEGLSAPRKNPTRKEILRFYKTNYTQISTFLQQISIINSVLSVQKYYQKSSKKQLSFLLLYK